MDKEYKLQLNKILKVAFEIMNCSKSSSFNNKLPITFEFNKKKLTSFLK